MTSDRHLLLFVIGLLFSGTGLAKVKLVTTTTDLAYVAQQVGGDKVEVHSLLDGTENPHYVDAVPKFIQLTADADVVCMVGLDLEIGWLPKVLAKSGNAKVQQGGAGYCDTSQGIAAKDKPAGKVDRSLGDVHPGGNPHYWLDPMILGQVASNITSVLIGVDPKNAELYLERQQQFAARMSTLKQEVEAKLARVLPNFEPPHLMEYHSEFSYFLAAYGLASLGTIEEKPGVKPAAGRLAQMAIKMRQSNARFVLAAPYNPETTLQRFSELSGAKTFIAPTSLRFDTETRTAEALQHALADGIIAHLAGPTLAQP